MTQTLFGNIAVLRIPLDQLSLTGASEEVPQGYRSFHDNSGNPVAARALGEVTLLIPLKETPNDEDLGKLLRSLIGQREERVYVIFGTEDAALPSGYDELLACPGRWVSTSPATTSQGAFGIFASAAAGLETPEEKIERLKALAGPEDLEKAGEKLEEAVKKRGERGSMRKMLGATVGGSIFETALGDQLEEKPDAEDLDAKPNELEDPLKSAMGSNRKRTEELESELRKALDGTDSSKNNDETSSIEPSAKTKDLGETLKNAFTAPSDEEEQNPED